MFDAVRHALSACKARVLIGIVAGFAMMSTGALSAPPSLTTLYTLTGWKDGGFPETNVIVGGSGALFGTAYAGGSLGAGTVFELLPPGTTGGAWTEQTLYTFTGGADGANPIGSLVIGAGGILYGTTVGGGTAGYGTVFSLVPGAGGTYTESVLHSFSSGADGANPAANLILGAGGSALFGTTYNGGTSDCGTVFELTLSGGVWTESVIYTFTGAADGGNPRAGLISNKGVLYGTTYEGGASGFGTVFELLPPMGSGGIWTEKVLYSFLGGADGAHPEAGLVMGKLNVLYGSAYWGGSTGCPVANYPLGCGTIFELLPPSAPGGTWTQKVLYTFTGTGADGTHPYGNMVLSIQGALFGTTYSGGSQSGTCFLPFFTGCGTAWILKPPTAGGAWTKSNLHVFTGDDGGGPTGLIQGSTGSFFGTTYFCGSTGSCGTVFQLTP